MTNRITRPRAQRLRRNAHRRSVDTQARYTSGRVAELLTLHLGNPISSAELARFTRQLATLLKAGVALLQAFDMLAESCSNVHLRRLLLATSLFPCRHWPRPPATCWSCALPSTTP